MVIIPIGWPELSMKRSLESNLAIVQWKSPLFHSAKNCQLNNRYNHRKSARLRSILIIKTASTSEIIEQVHNIVSEGSSLTKCEIAFLYGISKTLKERPVLLW